jgi:hypothetical protein
MGDDQTTPAGIALAFCECLPSRVRTDGVAPSLIGMALRIMRHTASIRSGALIKFIGLGLLGSVLPLASNSALGGEPAHRAWLNALISQHAKAYGIPEALVHHVIRIESNYTPDTLSRGNYGLMQIRHATAQGMGYGGTPVGLLDAETNLAYGVPYLANAYHVAGGDQDRTIALYKSGYYYEAKRKGLVGTLVKAKPPSTMAAFAKPGSSGPDFASATSAKVSPLPVPVIQEASTNTLSASASTLSRGVPEPPRRPADLGDPSSDGKAARPVAEAKPAEGPVGAPEFNDCMIRLQRMGLIAEIAVLPNATNAACMIENPVRLESLKVSGEQHVVGFPDRPILACRFAERFGQWVGEIAAPLIAARLAPLRSVQTGPGHDCRNRNRAAAGKLSAHAVGQAVDIAAFTLGAGETLSITEVGDERKKRVLATIQTAACGWFTTVLGPGSDPAHATHWHFDIEKHGSSDNYRICAPPR